MGAVGLRPRWVRARHRDRWILVILAGTGIVIGWRLLSGTYTLFQHAYLGSYWAVSGGRVASVYWGSVRFAFQTTVLVAAGMGVLGALVWVEAGRGRRR